MAQNLEGGGGGGGGQKKQGEKKGRGRSFWGWRHRRGFLVRRRRVQTERLGGKKEPRQRMAALAKAFRKMKLKLKECYENLVKEMAEAGSSAEGFQNRLFMEAAFGVPIGISFSGTLFNSSFAAAAAADNHRTPQPTKAKKTHN